MKLSVFLALAGSASAAHHQHSRNIKRDSNGANVDLVYGEEVTYLVKKGPQTTVTEAAGTFSTYYTTTYTDGAATVATSSATASPTSSSPASSSSASVSSVESKADIASSSSADVTSSSSADVASSSVARTPTSTAESTSGAYTSTLAPAYTFASFEPSSSASSAAYTSASAAEPTYASSSYVSSFYEPSAASSSAAASSTASSTDSSSSSGSTSDDYNSSSFSKDILSEHNVKRALHGVDSLAWNTTLAEYAQNYADSYSCPSNGALKHSGGPYGENLASGYSSATSVVDGWYNEIKSYNFASGTFTENTGHFTQVVWADTTQLGCAYKKCNTDFNYYVICSYYPAGNVIGVDWSKMVPALK